MADDRTPENSGGAGSDRALVVDRALVERVSQAEVTSGFRLAAAAVAVEAAAAGGGAGFAVGAVDSDSRSAAGAGALAVADGVTVSTGPGTYVNRGWGLGISEAVTGDHLDAVVAFFAERAHPAALEVTQWTDPDLLVNLGRRGWRMGWFLTTYGRRLHPANLVAEPRLDPGIRVTVATTPEREEWIDTVVVGNEPADRGEGDRARRFAEMVWTRPEETFYLARAEGRVVGCARLEVIDGLAFLAGAATLPSARRRGAQSALLAARLGDAASAGCDLAVVSADPLGPSARNIQRAGFVVLWASILATSE